MDPERDVQRLTRRDVLKLGLFGAVAWLWPRPRRQAATFPPDLQGRVAWDKVAVFDRPSFQGKRLDYYWRDEVFPIDRVVIGEGEPLYNRLWYRIPGQGYVHSGPVQPVRTLLQSPGTVPEGGVLAEVTVPYTDARWQPNPNARLAYRLYYATVYRVRRALPGADGLVWYEIVDDKWELVYYAPARHLRLLSRAEVAPLSPQVPPQAKRVFVDLGRQLVLAYEQGRLVFAARAATGMGYFATPSGSFTTFHKRPYRHMARGNRAEPEYDLPGVPWVCYITEEGVSFHGTYWHNDYGRPRSHGCINLSPQAAKWLYRWTLPTVPFERDFVYKPDAGTLVEIY